MIPVNASFIPHGRYSCTDSKGGWYSGGPSQGKTVAYSQKGGCLKVLNRIPIIFRIG